MGRLSYRHWAYLSSHPSLPTPTRSFLFSIIDRLTSIDVHSGEDGCHQPRAAVGSVQHCAEHTLGGVAGIACSSLHADTTASRVSGRRAAWRAAHRLHHTGRVHCCLDVCRQSPCHETAFILPCSLLVFDETDRALGALVYLGFTFFAEASVLSAIAGCFPYWFTPMRVLILF